MSSYTTYRGFDCCTCMPDWLDLFTALGNQRGYFDGAVKILQLRGSNPASAGTHAEGGAFDLGFYSGEQARNLVSIARPMGADATWYRAWDGNHHVHGVLRGCSHNAPARYQIDAVDDGYNGLGYMGQDGPDDGPRPLSYRSYTQGMQWAREEMDDVTAKDVWDYQMSRDGGTPYSAASWLTLAGTSADEVRDDINAIKARLADLESIPGDVWAQQVTRDGYGTYQAQSWLTLGATAADEMRDEANAVGGAVSEYSSAIRSAVLALAILGLVAVAVLALVIRP